MTKQNKILLLLTSILLTIEGFGQCDSQSYISSDQAIAIAYRHGLHARFYSRKKLTWDSEKATLDSLDCLWKVRTSKFYYKHWGKTSKIGKSDERHPCRDVNDCHVIQTRTVWIDAVKGKILKIENEKLVSGNYE